MERYTHRERERETDINKPIPHIGACENEIRACRACYPSSKSLRDKGTRFKYLNARESVRFLGEKPNWCQVLLIQSLANRFLCACSLSGCPQKDKLTPESKYSSIELINSYCSYIVHLLFARMFFSLWDEKVLSESCRG